MLFKFYSANMSINGIAVAVYENKNGTYTLQAEKDGERVEGSYTAVMTVEQYSDLPADDYNDMVRYQSALEQCGLFVH